MYRRHRLKRDSTTVKLIVEPEKTVLVYSRSLLGFDSRVLGSTFYGGFKEATNQEMELPEDDLNEIMTGLWVQTGVNSLGTIYDDSYRDPIDVEAYKVEDGKYESTEQESSRTYYCSMLARLWILENKLLAPNSVMPSYESCSRR